MRDTQYLNRSLPAWAALRAAAERELVVARRGLTSAPPADAAVVVLRARVSSGSGLPHVRVDVEPGAAYHIEHVDDLVKALRAAGADERGIEVACARAYELALPDRPGRGRSAAA